VSVISCWGGGGGTGQARRKKLRDLRRKGTMS
jgi:hypothetical protein